jgi:hypothetical protein
MAAFRIFNFARSRSVSRSAYDDPTPLAVRATLNARWSFSSQGRPACRWQA